MIKHGKDKISKGRSWGTEERRTTQYKGRDIWELEESKEVT